MPARLAASSTDNVSRSPVVSEIVVDILSMASYAAPYCDMLAVPNDVQASYSDVEGPDGDTKKDCQR
jgi:hypothetical protein